jgi:hypothetical protein
MQRCHNIRLGLMSTVILAEPFLANEYMIILMAVATIAAMFCTRRQIALHEQEACARTARSIFRKFSRRHDPQTDE